MIRVAVTNRTKECPVDRRLLRRAVLKILEQAGIETGEISVGIVDDATMAELHQRFLHQEGPTDVLSFPLEEGEGHLEGDVIVSADTARRWAARIGWPPEHELLLYVIHGTLHLVGYNDRTPAERKKMRQAERNVLAQLGISPPARR